MGKSLDHNRDFVLELLGTGLAVERRLDSALSHVCGITFSEYQLLRTLGQAHASTATRVGLASAVGLTASGVTRALKPLEKLGYVETRKDARDARRSLAMLTAHGETLVANASGIIDDTIREFGAFGGLTASDRQTFLGFLKQLRRD